MAISHPFEPMSVPASFRRYCRLLRFAALFVFSCLLLLLGLGLAGPPMFHAGLSTSDTQSRLLMLVRVLPGAGYLWALWAVQRALEDLAAGRLFHETLTRGLRNVGLGVLAGALLSVFAITNLTRMIAGGRGNLMYFDLSGIVLGVVGAALVLFSRVIDHAREVQAELDEII